MTSEFLKVAEIVLANRGESMTARQIVDFATQNRMFSDRVAGKTPFQTMKSKLSVDIRTKGTQSIFVRTGRGRFYLRARIDESTRVYEARPYVKAASAERVLTIPIKDFRRVVRFQGVNTRFKLIRRRLLDPRVCKYEDRLTAELSNESKQVLTYILVTRGSRVLCFRRGNFSRVEDFLRGSTCVGFGGHVSEQDLSLLSDEDMGLSESAKRELLEELKFPDIDRRRLLDGVGLTCLGILNDDSSAVGRRHVAFVYRYEASDDSRWDAPQRGEKSVAQLHWIAPTDLGNPIWQFEYWSQLCLRQFFPQLAKLAPAFRLVRPHRLRRASVICVIGSLGSGKTEAVRVLSGAFGFQEINSGRVLARLLRLPPVTERTRSRFQQKALKFIRTPGGPARLAAAMAELIRKSGDTNAVIDGIRQLCTFNELCERIGRERIATVYVHTLPDVAYRFYSGRSASPISFERFLGLREAEVEREIPDFLRKADAVIYNWAGHGAYLRTTRSLFSRARVGSVKR